MAVKGVINKENRIAFLIMSDYMNHPNLLWAEAKKVLDAQLKYLEGKFEESYKLQEAILSKTKDYDIKIACLCGMELCVAYMGDSKRWLKIFNELKKIPPRNDEAVLEKELVLFALRASTGIPTRCPDWLLKGEFYGLNLEHTPFAIMECMIAHMLSPSHTKEYNPKSHEIICSIVDIVGIPTPMVYTHLIQAACYHDIGDMKNCKNHIDTALDIAVPRKWLAPLVELRRFIGVTLDHMIKERDEDLFNNYKELFKIYANNWNELYEELEDIHPFKDLTVREIEIAKYAAIGKGNKEIAYVLGISMNTVKGAIANILVKAGIDSRKDLSKYLNM